MMQEFDELVQKRAALKAWWELGSTKVGYGDGCHKLRIDVAKPTMVAFCGQAYAGARNYHDAPAFFVEAIRQEMHVAAKRLAREAYENELARLDAAIEKHRDAVLAQLSSA